MSLALLSRLTWVGARFEEGWAATILIRCGSGWGEGVIMVRYWLCVTNQANWRVVKEKLIWGVSERYRRRMEELSPGDLLVFYVRPKRIAGIFKAASKPFVDKKRIFSSEGFRTDEVFPHRVRLEPVLVPPEPVPFEPLVPKLKFIKNKARWTGHLRGAMRPIPEEDYELIKSALKAGQES